MGISRGDLKRAKRENLERLAHYLKLSFDSGWSQGHLARLVYWRIKRDPFTR